MAPVVPVTGAEELVVPQIHAPEEKLRCWPEVSAQVGIGGAEGLLVLDCFRASKPEATTTTIHITVISVISSACRIPCRIIQRWGQV
jgi:hypothetical protein